MGRGDEGSAAGVGVQGIAGTPFSGFLDQGFHKAVIDGAFHQDARSAQADLAGVLEGGAGHTLHRRLEIAVREHEAGVLAAQFQAELFELGCRDARHQRAAGGAAGEGDGLHPGMAHQGRPRFGAQAVDQVHDAVWGSQGLQFFHEQMGADRGEFTGLGHHGVAHGEGRGELPG